MQDVLIIDWQWSVNDEFAYSSKDDITHYESQTGTLPEQSVYNKKASAIEGLQQSYSHFVEWCRLLNLNGADKVNAFIDANERNARFVFVPLSRNECSMQYNVKLTYK